MLDPLTVLFLIVIVTFLGFFGHLVFKSKGIPETLSLIFLGIVAQVVGFVPQSAVTALIPILSQLTLAMLLFGLGMEFNLRDLFREGSTAIVRSLIYMFLGVSLTAGIFYASGAGPYQSLLLGSIIGGETTVLAIPAITKRLSKNNVKLVTNLVTEAVFNSVVLVILFFVFLEGYLRAAPLSLAGAETMLQTFLFQFGIGASVGAVAVLFWIKFLRIMKNAEYLYLSTFGYVLGIYILATKLGGSGILAVLLLGVMFLNLGKSYVDFALPSGIEQYVSRFQGEISFFLKTFFFVFLGLDLSLSSFFSITSWLIAGAAMIALFGSRYFATRIVDHRKDPLTQRIILYMIAQGLTPAVLATTLLAYNVPGSAQIILVTTLIIILTNIITAIASVRLSSSIDKLPSGLDNYAGGTENAQAVHTMGSKTLDLPNAYIDGTESTTKNQTEDFSVAHIS